MLSSQYLESIKKKYYYFYLNGIDTSNKIFNDFLIYSSYQSSIIHGCDFNFSEAYNYLTKGYTYPNKDFFDYLILNNIYDSQKWFYSLFNDLFLFDINVLIQLNNHLLSGIEYRVKNINNYKVRKKIIKGKIRTEDDIYFDKDKSHINKDCPSLIEKINKMLDDIYYTKHIDITHIVDFYVSFLILKPFDMANGRAIRIIINYILYKANLPFISFNKDDKIEYEQSLSEYIIGKKERLIKYFLSILETNSILSFNILSSEKNNLIINEHIP